MAGRRKRADDLPNLSQEEVFARMNASAARTLEALQQAYEAGAKEGFSDEEEDQVIELLRRAKRLRDHVKQITEAPAALGESGRQSADPSGTSPEDAR